MLTSSPSPGPLGPFPMTSPMNNIQSMWFLLKAGQKRGSILAQQLGIAEGPDEYSAAIVMSNNINSQFIDLQSDCTKTEPPRVQISVKHMPVLLVPGRQIGDGEVCALQISSLFIPKYVVDEKSSRLIQQWQTPSDDQYMIIQPRAACNRNWRQMVGALFFLIKHICLLCEEINSKSHE